MKKLIVFTFLALALSACSKLTTLVIVHANDTHSQVMPAGTGSAARGGAARQAVFVAQTRANEPNVLVLHGGDTMTGSLYSVLYHGEFDFELMDAIGYEYCAVGNHEFDYGLSNILALRDAVHFELLSANVLDEDGAYVFRPYAVTNIAGERVAIVGISTADWSVYNPDLRGQIEILPEAVALSNVLYGLGIAETNDFVICLSHSGIDRDKVLAKLFPEVDVFVGGHSHSRTPVPVEAGNNWVVQAGSNGEMMGVATFRLRGGRVVGRDYDLLPLDRSVTNSPRVEAMIAERDAQTEGRYQRVIATATAEISRARLGRLISDAICEATGCDVAAVNAGGVRASIPAGEVALSRMSEVYPFSNEIIVVTVTGELLKRIAGRGMGGGGYLYYSTGFETRRSGSIDVSLDGVPVEDDRLYTIGVNDFMYKGGDGFVEFAEAQSARHTGLLVRDVFANYVEKMKVLEP